MSTPWYQFAITQGYGVNGESGVDLGTPLHTPLYAPLGGTVESADYHSYGGLVSILTNLPGVGTVREYFAHVDSIAPGLTAGSTISPGQYIGLSGGELPGTPGGVHPAYTGSTGPHTEFGFFTGQPFVSQSVDPMNILGSLKSGIPLPFGPVSGPEIAQGKQAADNAGNLLDTLKAIAAGQFKDALWRTGLIVAGVALIFLGLQLLFAHAAVDVINSPAGQTAGKAALA